MSMKQDERHPRDGRIIRESRGRRPDAAGLFGIIFLALMILLALVPRDWIAPHLPRALQSRGAWIMLLFVMAMPAVIVAAVLVKLVEVAQASRWKQTIGTIQCSEVKSQTRHGDDHRQQTYNLPLIRYDYEVDGRHYRSERISIGEIAPDDPRIPELLARYKPGARIKVFYNPDRPQQAVLERGGPKGLMHITWILALVVILIGGAAGWMLFPDAVAGWLAPRLPPQANPHLTLFFSLTTVFALLRFFATLTGARRSARWSSTMGEVTVSEIESRRDLNSRGGHNQIYSLRLVYRYRVGEHEYRSSRIGSTLTLAGSAWIVRRQLSRYPLGSAVKVWYNPANPAEAQLQAGGQFSSGGLMAVGVSAALAWFFATH